MLSRFVLNHRLPLILAVNLLTGVASLWLAVATRFDFDFFAILRDSYLLPLLILLTLRCASYMYWGLNEGYWRYTSTRDVFVLVKAHAASSLCFMACIFLFRLEYFPRSVIFIEFALSLLLAFGLRIAVREVGERLRTRARGEGSPASRDVLVIGAGDSGHLLVKILHSQSRLGYRPVAVLDDNENLRGLSVFGVPVVGGLADLPQMLRRFSGISAAIVAIPTLSKVRFDELKERCDDLSVPLKRLQSFEDLACLDAGSGEVGLSVEAMLDREVSVTHEDEIRHAIHGRKVLVTGAGGSIGSEIVRQVLDFAPAEVILVDSCEYNLFRIEQELRRRGEGQRVRSVLLDVTSRARLRALFNTVRPEFVLHAAAYKHVPLLEENCTQAFLNNVVGTRNVLSCALDYRASRFVLISTDKAVNPISVMGATKRIAELLTLQSCRIAERAGNDKFSAAAVRFGNVINSTGSVIPLFREQIASGGPITVTHPEMERYFMSIREAVRLVLTAGTLCQSGEVYVLNMGRPIRIYDVAKKMRALYGRRDIPIVFTGVRPGEKLSEVLTLDVEKRTATRFEKVSMLLNASSSTADVFEWSHQVERIIERLSDVELGRMLVAFASGEQGEELNTLSSVAG